MRRDLVALSVAAVIVVPAVVGLVLADGDGPRRPRNVQVGPRPYYLVEDMQDGWLKQALESCSEGPFEKTDFSIGHRGAALQFPEHTKESYEAAARQGAGIVECDVTFTKDKELVCRHSQCDLHTTTNILATDLAGKCSTPPDDTSATPFKNVLCCTSDITLEEFKSLKGKMDAANPNAKTLAEYLNATPDWRTDLYSQPYDPETKSWGGTLLTHAESIELFKALGVKMTPELKSPSVPMPFDGFSQEDYAQKMIDEYKDAGVPPQRVWAQSFNREDVLYWIRNEPAFGRQAVYLDDANVPADVPSYEDLRGYRRQGIRIWAPPTWVLVGLDSNGKIVPSRAALDAKRAGLDIITWTLERSGLLRYGGGYYYQSLSNTNPPFSGKAGVIDRDGDTYELLDVLAKDVGILGIFSDWPGTVTYYDNCMSRRRGRR
jgi:glycerophosphoryl diester phosphodiesterase